MPVQTETKTTSNSATVHSAAFLISVLVFQQIMGAITFPIAKYGLAYIEPYTFAFYRFLISSVCLYLIVRTQKNQVPVEKSDWIKIIGLGVLIIPLNQMVYLIGQSMTAAGHGAFLYATAPIWLYVLAMLHLGEKLMLRRATGIVIALAGVAMIMFSGVDLAGEKILWGDLLILVAVISFCYYTVAGKRLVEKYGALRLTTYSMIAGSLMYFPFGVVQAVNFDYSMVPNSAWLSVVYLGLGTSLGGWVLWYWVLKYMDVSRMAVYNNLEPVIGTAVAWAWLNEPIGWPFVSGAFVVLAGVLVSEIRSGMKPDKEIQIKNGREDLPFKKALYTEDQ